MASLAERAGCVRLLDRPAFRAVILVLGDGAGAVLELDQPIPGVVGSRERLSGIGRLGDRGNVADAVVDGRRPRGTGDRPRSSPV